MKDPQTRGEDSQAPMEDPEARLEQMYIEEYLHGKGHTWESARKLPEEETKRLMTEASTFASTKLAEVNARAHAVEDIHGASKSDQLHAATNH